MRNYTFKEIVLRLVAIVALIIVLLLGLWGILQLIFWLPTFFSNVTGNIGGMFNRQAPEALVLTVPSGVVADQTFSVSWDHKNAEGEHRYALAYQCRDGVSFETALADGKMQKVECDKPFNFTAATSTIELTPRLTKGTAATTVGISAAAIAVPGGALTATTTATTVVSPALVATTTPAKPATTKPASTGTNYPSGSYYPSGRTTNLYGLADLHLAINAAYVSGGRAAVQFTVSNIGTNVAPAGWNFAAVLPIQGSYTYTAPAQQALYPGDRIVFTMGYDSFSQFSGGYIPYDTTCYGRYDCWYGPQQQHYGGAQTVTIVVDPYSMVYEANKANNTASRTYYSY